MVPFFRKPCRWHARRRPQLLLPASAAIALALALVSAATQPNPAGAKLFAEKVAPLFQQRCLECHSGPKPRAGLDLTTREHLLAGGTSGPSVVPGNAGESLLIKMVTGPKAKMPQKGQALSAAEVAALRQWIDDGAPWPAEVTLAPAKGAVKTWWSALPLHQPPVPKVEHPDWVRNPLDAFVLAKMEEMGLTPSPEVDRVEFLRRAKFDLHGLPPTPEEIDEFVNDTSPNAFERLIDRLLASSLYGERWGRFWLDIAHYADTHGFDKDKRRPWAWLFRDWVIHALNADIPYHRFVTLQIAGDVLEPNTAEGIIATGFVVAGPWDFVGQVELKEGTVDKLKTRNLDRDDMVQNVFAAFQSTTVGCARCHDHKFDPISQKEYYQLQAVFAGVERGDRVIPGTPPWLVGMTEAESNGVVWPGLRLCEAPASRVVQTFLSVRPDASTDRNVCATQSSQGFADSAPATPDTILSPRAYFQKVAGGPKAYAIMPIAPRPIHLLKRGDVEQPKDLVGPGSLSLLPGHTAALGIENAKDEGQRRLALAKWITDKNNVLTWRSIVNRVWQYHFGQGLVDTPNDFGKNGSRPTHPELLDWLATEFRDGGQSLKKLHKLIMLSAAYRQSTKHNAANAKKDADNRYLWKMNRRKLDAEALRDSVLFVSGQLNLQMGGPGYDLFRFKDDHSPVYDHSDIRAMTDPKTYRRTVYRFIVRSVPNPFLETLDCADPNISVPRRNETLTALQSLALLNNPFMIKQSEFFAARLEKLSADPKKQINWAYRLAFSRPPTPAELTAVLAYRQKHGLANACRILFNTNEFMFVE